MKNLIKTTFLLICSVFAFTASLTLQAQTIADLQADIDQNEADSDAADTALGNRITDETTARTNADDQLQTNISTEASARATEDTNLGNRITSETTAREAADGATRT